MLILLSPAKTLDLTSPVPDGGVTEPVLASQARQVAAALAGLPQDELADLLAVSDRIAAQAQAWHRDLVDGSGELRPAAWTFAGDVYEGLEVAQWSTADVAEAAQTVRLLSGLYGLLRPGDGMLPYRLQMGSKLAVGEHRDLYQFWRDAVTETVVDAVTTSPGADVVVNLASTEYAQVVRWRDVLCDVVEPVFWDETKTGAMRVVSFYAKRARGMMASWLVRTRARTWDEVYGFAEAGYQYCERSTAERAGRQDQGRRPARPVFRRERTAVE